MSTPAGRAQRAAALVEANRIRTTRARFKAQLRAGALDWRTLLEHPDTATMLIRDILRALPKIGPRKVRTILETAGLPAMKTIGSMTAPQRAELEAAVALHTPRTPRRR